MDFFKDTTLLLKFGQKCHLESLKAGNLFFNPISKFRNDGTLFRGDENEGKIPINPSTFFIDGKCYGDIIKSVMASYEGDDNMFIFCTLRILTQIVQLFL